MHFCEKSLLSRNQHQIDGEEAIDWRTHGVLLIQADVFLGRKKGALSQDDQQRIRNASSKKLDDVVGNLLCVIGAPYLILNNADVSKGIANGTLTYVEDIILHDSATPRLVHLYGMKVRAVYTKDVKCLIFKHTLGDWAEKKLFPTLPDGCFPLLAQKHSPHFKFNGQNLAVSVVQFPCVLALVLTGHKVQGQGLDAVILGAISNKYKYGAEGWLFVILSRVRFLLGLSTLVRLPSNPASYKPRLRVAAEMQRLGVKENVTLARLRSFMLAPPT